MHKEDVVKVENIEDESVSASSSSSEDDNEGIDTNFLASELSIETLQALQSHLNLRTANMLEEDNDNEEEESKKKNVSENFGLSQFWYDDETSCKLASEIVRKLKIEFPISSEIDTEDKQKDENQLSSIYIPRLAILSAPSLMRGFIQKEEHKYLLPKIALFEYDERFGREYPVNFHYYNYNKADELPVDLLGMCDFIFYDPPYLNMETFRAFHKSASLLAKSHLIPKELPKYISDSDENAKSIDKNPSAKNQSGKHASHTSDNITPMLIITSTNLSDSLCNEFHLLPTLFEPTFESKFMSPMYTYCNYNIYKSDKSLLESFLDSK